MTSHNEATNALNQMKQMKETLKKLEKTSWCQDRASWILEPNLKGMEQSLTSSQAITRPVVCHLRVGHSGRKHLQVIEWALHSMSWGLVCGAWGAEVILSITESPKITALVKLLLPHAEIKSAARAMVGTKRQDCVGDLFVGTVLLLRELPIIANFITALNPKIVMFGIKHPFSRKLIMEGMGVNLFNSLYKVQLRSLTHVDVCRATVTKWKFLIMVTQSTTWPGPYLRKARTCPQELLTIINDTLGGGWRIDQRLSHNLNQALTEDKRLHELGWDLNTLNNIHDCWVLALSVYAKDLVLRTLASHELLALWDFPQPKATNIPMAIASWFLLMLIQGPPGKLIRKVVQEPLNYL